MGKLAGKWMGANVPFKLENEGKEDLWWWPGEWCVRVCSVKPSAVTKSLPSHRKDFQINLGTLEECQLHACTRPGYRDPKGKSWGHPGWKSQAGSLGLSQSSQLVGESG